MRIGSDNSIFSLFVPSARNSSSVANEKGDFETVEPPKAPPVKSDEQLVDDFYARMAKQLIDAADTNHDGKVTKDEYTASGQRLAQASDQQFDAESSENQWSKLDPTDKGWADEDDIIDGFKNTITVNVGHLDPDYAAALRIRPPEN